MSYNEGNTVRASVVQLDAYGPWTVTPEPRRETDIQALQARLYADFADFMGYHDGYAFFNRFDNMIGIGNHVSVDEYKRFQERIRNRYPVTASIGIGEDATPAGAIDAASEGIQSTGSAQDLSRNETVQHVQKGPDTLQPKATIAHFDIVDVTSKYTDQQSEIATQSAVWESVSVLKRVLYEEYDSAAYFVGGDNVIAICPSLDTHAFKSILEEIHQQTSITYQVGVGEGQTAHEAGDRAKHALERCRENGTRLCEYESDGQYEHYLNMESAND